MSILSRLLGTAPDPREDVRPLWHRVIELARDPDYYRECRVADSVAGRFDMISAVLCTVMVRLEQSDLRAESALLAELFVEDMDGQLRELGIDDVVVGKHIGRLMSVLGGRLGAYRSALASQDHDRLAAAATRNITFAQGADETKCGPCVADKLLALSRRLSAQPDNALLQAGEIE